MSFPAAIVKKPMISEGMKVIVFAQICLTHYSPELFIYTP